MVGTLIRGKVAREFDFESNKKKKKETPLASPVQPSIPMYGGDALLRRSPAIDIDIDCAMAMRWIRLPWKFGGKKFEISKL